MADIQRLASTVLLGLGVLLVFFGLNAVLGFTPFGAVASLAVVAALLYAGAAWSAPPVRPSPGARFTTPIVFDRDGREVSGAECGRALSERFPETLRAEVNQRCAAALAGISGHVAGDDQGRPVIFEFLPVRSSNGSVVYGLLVMSEASATPMAVSA